MHKHLHVSVETQIIACGAVYGTGIATGQPVDIQGHRLLVKLCVTAAGAVPFLTFYAGRQHIRHRLAGTVFLNIDRRDAERCLLTRTCCIIAGLKQFLSIFAPSGIHQVKCGKAQDDRLLKAVEEHTHESYRLESIDVAYLLIRLTYRYAELIPLAGRRFAVGQLNIASLLYVYNVVLANHHILRLQVYNVLVIVLCLT